MSVLAERLLAVHAALDKAALPHAFGGAIALAYCTHEPRGTRDLDVNVFVGTDRADEVLDSMPAGVSVNSVARAALRRDGQVRVMWGETPVDLFLNTHDFHTEAAVESRTVPFESTNIPVLACDTLIVLKAMFNRTRDWADIESIIEAGSTDGRAALDRLRTLLDDENPAFLRLAALVE